MWDLFIGHWAILSNNLNLLTSKLPQIVGHNITVCGQSFLVTVKFSYKTSVHISVCVSRINYS